MFLLYTKFDMFDIPLFRVAFPARVKKKREGKCCHNNKNSMQTNAALQRCNDDPR